MEVESEPVGPGTPQGRVPIGSEARRSGTPSEFPALDIDSVSDVLRGMCHRLLRDFPAVRRWDQTDDIVQQSALKLVKAMQTIAPCSQRHLENLAAMQVRRTLIDLVRKHAASAVLGNLHWTPTGPEQSFSDLADSQLSGDVRSDDIERWLELHESIAELPLENREVFELIWYRGLTKPEVATLLSVDLRTVQRRWRSARERLLEKFDGEFFA